MKNIKLLPPIQRPTKYYEQIEAILKHAFLTIIYQPLLEHLEKKKIFNARWDLNRALREGKISYSAGAFRGNFTQGVREELRQLGAVWDGEILGFKIPLPSLPYELREAILVSDAIFKKRIEAIDKRLSEISIKEVIKKIRITDVFDNIILKTEQDLQISMKNITVSPGLDEAQRIKIAREWQDNMDLWVQKFTEDHIKQLRSLVQDALFTGNRNDSLAQTIKSSFLVSDRKAKFLARQETNLLVAKLKEARYESAGVFEYRWACVHNPKDKTPKQHTPGNVRYSHGLLDGKIFRFDSPPVTTAPNEPQRRNNPGEDYNCRCTAIPIVKF